MRHFERHASTHAELSQTPVDHTVTCEASNPARLKLITKLIRNHHAIISIRRLSNSVLNLVHQSINLMCSSCPKYFCIALARLLFSASLLLEFCTCRFCKQSPSFYTCLISSVASAHPLPVLNLVQSIAIVWWTKQNKSLRNRTIPCFGSLIV